LWCYWEQLGEPQNSKGIPKEVEVGEPKKNYAPIPKEKKVG
jgi:hypothetical protein